MAVATKEAPVMEKTQDVPRTFKQAGELTGQQYHYLHRVVGLESRLDGTLSGDKLDEAVMEWTVGKGFRIQEIHFLGQHKGTDGNVHGYVYGYHLVKG